MRVIKLTWAQLRGIERMICTTKTNLEVTTCLDGRFIGSKTPGAIKWNREGLEINIEGDDK